MKHVVLMLSKRFTQSKPQHTQSLRCNYTNNYYGDQICRPEPTE